MILRELKNGIKIIGTDLGYGNAKSSGTVTKSAVQAYDTEPIFSGNTLEYNGKYYRIGEGHKPFIIDKSEDEDFYILNMAAMARELNRYGIYEAKVYLATGLPLTWVRTQRDSFKEYLMKNEELYFKYNDKEYHITLVGCSVYPQSYPAVIEMLGDLKGTNVIADIGNGTMNILYIKDKKPIEAMCRTEKLGVYQCVMRIQRSIMDRYGVKLDEGIAEDYLRYGSADISREYLRLFNDEAVGYVKSIFEALAKYDYDPNTMRLYIIGGGGIIVKNFGTFDKDNVTIITDICANAKGYEYLAYLTQRKKE